MGLAVALACDLERPLLLSDMEVMFDLMKRNISLNEIESKVEPLILNWQVNELDVYVRSLTISQGRTITGFSKAGKTRCYSSS